MNLPFFPYCTEVLAGGMARAVDLGATLTTNTQSQKWITADEAALCDDWNRVGDDLRDVMPKKRIEKCYQRRSAFFNGRMVKDMAVKFGSARIDERGKISGGAAGDQTGKEVMIQDFYVHAKGWVMLRPINPDDAEKMAQCMEEACADNRIGYDQGQRLTLYNAIKAVGFAIKKLTKKVETDCSALVRVCCEFAGIKVADFVTANQVSAMMKTGKFVKYTDKLYTQQSAYLRRGDVLVTKTSGHTGIILTNGSKAAKPEAPTNIFGSRVLKIGSSGSDVRELQSLLVGWGYDLGKWGADGDFGADTQKAVKAWQLDNDLTVDGVMDTEDYLRIEMLIALDSTPEPEPSEPVDVDAGDAPEEPTPEDENQPDPDGIMGANPYKKPVQVKKKGSFGETVKWIQAELNESGYDLVVDGDFGSKTDKAVREFQQRHKLTVDGQVGTKTVAALVAEVGRCEHDAQDTDVVDDAPASNVVVVPTTDDRLTPAQWARLNCDTIAPDISHHDPKMDGAKFKAPFVWNRSGDSQRTYDANMKHNIKQAIKYGIPWGNYMFSRAGSKSAMKAEIDRWIKHVRESGHDPSLGWWFDIEVDASTVEAVKYGVEYMRSLLPEGAFIGIYIANRLYNKFKKILPLFDSIWVPRYSNKPPDNSNYDIHQFGFRAFAGVNGTKKTVDANRPKPGKTWQDAMRKLKVG